MIDFFDDEDGSANDPMHEALHQALADMFDAVDMLENGGALANLILRAFQEAKEALAALVDQPTQDPEISALQAQVKRYGDLIRWTRDIVNEGQDAEKILGDEAREDLSKLARGDDRDDYQD